MYKNVCILICADVRLTHLLGQALARLYLIWVMGYEGRLRRARPCNRCGVLCDVDTNIEHRRGGRELQRIEIA